MEFLTSMDAKVWAAVVGGAVVIGAILMLKMLKGFLKPMLILAVLAAVVYILWNAGVINIR